MRKTEMRSVGWRSEKKRRFIHHRGTAQLQHRVIRAEFNMSCSAFSGKFFANSVVKAFNRGARREARKVREEIPADGRDRYLAREEIRELRFYLRTSFSAFSALFFATSAVKSF
jgi:hypothetical protein